MNLVNIFVKAIFIENMIFAYLKMTEWCPWVRSLYGCRRFGVMPS